MSGIWLKTWISDMTNPPDDDILSGSIKYPKVDNGGISVCDVKGPAATEKSGSGGKRN